MISLYEPQVFWKILFKVRTVCIKEGYKWQSIFTPAKSLQSCPTLWDPRDGSPPGSPIPGILQARTLEWVAISFSNAGKWKVKVTSLSRVQLLATPWTAAHQAPRSMGFARQEYSSGLPLPAPPIEDDVCPLQASGMKTELFRNVSYRTAA